MRPFRSGILVSMVVLAMAPAQATEQQLHQNVQHSLVQLTTTGTARIGPFTGTEVSGNGTGFFVGSDGYILTTAHLFDQLKEANAANASIKAKFEGTGTGTVQVVYVSELASLDLVLLRAIVDNGIPVPPSLEIGDSKDVDLNVPALLTSGYDTTGYRKKALDFNSTSNALAAFAWTVNGKTNPGASGSPVYIDSGGKPMVVGILSATARDDAELSLMIPIEYSFQLIGQFKMKELQEEVARLTTMLGKANRTNPPLNSRVDDIEKSVNEIKESFSWTAETDDDRGTLVIKYHKVISDGPQIDQISVKIQPYTFGSDSSGNASTAQPEMTWNTQTLPRKSLESEERTGTFVMDEFKKKLTDVILNRGSPATNRDPFRDVVVRISADTGQTFFQTELIIEPKFSWNFQR